MPQFDLPIGLSGPICSVYVGVSGPRADAMKAAGIAVPAWVHGPFLIDTGASHTVIDPSFVAPLGLVSTGAIMAHTPSTNGAPQAFQQYDVCIFIPGAVQGQGWHVPALAVSEANLAVQGIQGLIGRDLLDQVSMFYNGPKQTFSFMY